MKGTQIYAYDVMAFEHICCSCNSSKWHNYKTNLPQKVTLVRNQDNRVSVEKINILQSQGNVM